MADIIVHDSELSYLASFGCQHKPSCDKVERGAICNSCWVSGWAKGKLAAQLKAERLRNSQPTAPCCPMTPTFLKQKRQHRADVGGSFGR